MAEAVGAKHGRSAAIHGAESKRKRQGEHATTPNGPKVSSKEDNLNRIYDEQQAASAPAEKKQKTSGSKVQTSGSSPSKSKQPHAPAAPSPPLKKIKDTKKVEGKSTSSVGTKQREESNKEAHRNDTSEDDDDDDDDNDDDVDVDDAASIKSAATKDGEEWKAGDILALLDQLRAVLPNDDNAKYSTMAERLDWGRVKVPGFSPAACKEQWISISTKLRRFRTMTELVSDAAVLVKQPKSILGKKIMKHPDMPKKPLTPYFRFFVAKREHYSAKHPELSATDLTKQLSKKYAKMSEEKKKRYLDDYNREMEAYRKAMDIFKSQHPELLEDDDKSCGNGATIEASKSNSHSSLNKSGPPKTTTACMIYINDMYDQEQKNNSTLTKKQLYEQYRDAWFKLSDSKKLPYINKAVEAKKQYDIDLANYRQIHPDYNPRPMKTFLTKAEMKIKDAVDGKPLKPPGNGYSLFTVETLRQLSDMANIERLGEVSKRWKKLSEEKREAYNLKAEEMNQEFREKYEKYLQSLPSDVRRKIEEEDNEKQNIKKKLVPPSAAILNGAMSTEKRTKPVAAVFIYIEDQKEAYKCKHPEMDDNEIQRQLVKEFNCLNDKEKAKYKLLEEKAKEKLAKETSQSTPTNTVAKKIKKKTFPGEPALPPHSGYQLFSKEMLLKMKDVKSNERLQEIGKRWSALSDSEKQKLNKRKEAMWAEYRKDVARFKKTLTASELLEYEDIHKPSKKKKKAAKEAPSSDENSSSSESSDDEDDKSKSSINELSDKEEEELNIEEEVSSEEESSSESMVSDSDDDDVADMITKPQATVAPNNKYSNVVTSTTIPAPPQAVKPTILSAADVYNSEDDDSDDDDDDSSSVTDSSDDD